MQERLIFCKNLSIGYNGRVIKPSINFEVLKGDYIVIIGENGAGKSTFIKTLLTLIKPLGGILDISKNIQNGSIGYLAQQSEIQKDFPSSVFEIVLSGFASKLKGRFFYTKKEKDIALDKLNIMNLKYARFRSFSSLSGGERQKVLLARSLCAASDAIILDEPFSALDSCSKTEMYNLLKDLNGRGMAIIMVSHDEVAIKYANKVLSLSGEPVFQSRDEYIKSRAQYV